MNSSPKKPGKAQLVAVAAILTSSLILSRSAFMETRYTRVDTGGMGWRPIIESYPYRGTANVIVVVAILLCLRILYGGVLYTLASSLMLRIRNLQDRTPSVANQEDDLKWMGRFGTWKYIPNRY